MLQLLCNQSVCWKGEDMDYFVIFLLIFPILSCAFALALDYRSRMGDTNLRKLEGLLAFSLIALLITWSSFLVFILNDFLKWLVWNFL